MNLRTPARLRALNLALRAFGARRVIPGTLKRRLTAIGITRRDLDGVLDRIRSVDGWHRAWLARARQASQDGSEAASSANLEVARSQLRLSSAAAVLGMALTDPLSGERRTCQEAVRRAHAALAGLDGPCLQPFELRAVGGPVRGYLHTPAGPGPHPLVVLLPPLGHVKEELGVAFSSLVSAGYALAGLDLPGTGESPGPLPLDAQHIVVAALDRLLARQLATQLTLEGVFQKVRCPTLLFHGGRDTIPIPRVIPWLLARAPLPVELVVYPEARHGCVDRLAGSVLTTLLHRLDRAMDRSPAGMAAACRPAASGAATSMGATFSTPPV